MILDCWGRFYILKKEVQLYIYASKIGFKLIVLLNFLYCNKECMNLIIK